MMRLSGRCRPLWLALTKVLDKLVMNLPAEKARKQ